MTDQTQLPQFEYILVTFSNAVAPLGLEGKENRTVMFKYAGELITCLAGDSPGRGGFADISKGSRPVTWMVESPLPPAEINTQLTQWWQQYTSGAVVKGPQKASYGNGSAYSYVIEPAGAGGA